MVTWRQKSERGAPISRACKKRNVFEKGRQKIFPFLFYFFSVLLAQTPSSRRESRGDAAPVIETLTVFRC